MDSSLSLDRKTLQKHLWFPQWPLKTIFIGDTGGNHGMSVETSEEWLEQWFWGLQEILVQFITQQLSLYVQKLVFKIIRQGSF